MDRRLAVMTLAWLLIATGCQSAPVTGAAPSPARSPSSDPSLSVVEKQPDWRPGDRWVFEWSSGEQSGTKTVEIRGIQEVNGVTYFVARQDEVDMYYTRDLHWAAAVSRTKVEARIAPPQPWFVWPLRVGREWSYLGTYEDRNGKTQRKDRFVVLVGERVEVPAGQFETLKIIRDGTQDDSDEYWYAPEVRGYVRWIGRRGNVSFEERLREYRAGPRTSGTRPSSGTS